MIATRKLASILWTAVPPILLSALIHTTDPDISGIGGLASNSTLPSVLFYAVPPILCCGLALAALVTSGLPAFLIVTTTFSAVAAAALTAFGSGATTPGGLAWAFIAGSILVFLFLAAAVVPAAAIGWPKSARSTSA